MPRALLHPLCLCLSPYLKLPLSQAYSMDKSVIQALTGLVPTLSPLPPQLVELAVSLLAQSRNKASSLKAEEEIARSYACAHLACERSVLAMR